MPSFNVMPSSVDKHTHLLNLLPLNTHDRVRSLTLEELFYLHNMIEYTGKNVSSLVLKNKALMFLAGVKGSNMHPNFIVAVAKTMRWQEAFYEFLAA